MKLSLSVAWVLLLPAISYAESGEKEYGLKMVTADSSKTITSYTLVTSTSQYTCQYYRADNTNNAQQNTASCYFSSCGGTTIIISGCDCTGDQYLRLYQGSTQVGFVDDGCGVCSYKMVTIPGASSSCNDYTLVEGCYESDSCTGTVTISGSNYVPPTVMPSPIPSVTPTLTIQPTTFAPTAAPSVSNAPTVSGIYCASYSATNTNSGTQNYATCNFIACGGQVVTVSGCGCTGDQYLRVYNASGTQITYSDDYCSLCSSVAFTPPGNSSVCQEYSIHEGCYSSNSCGGTVSVTGLVISAPTVLPTLVPTVVPTVSMAPTNSFYCPSYSATNTYYASQGYGLCSFVACGGSQVSISGCGCSGDQYIKLYSGNTFLTSSDDYCGACSAISYLVSGNSSTCGNYTIYEGCFGDGLCSGSLLVSGAAYFVVSPTAMPTTAGPSVMPTSASPSATRVPTLAPSKAPVVKSNELKRPPPLVYSVVIPVVVVSVMMMIGTIIYFQVVGRSTPFAGKVYATANVGDVEMT